MLRRFDKIWISTASPGDKVEDEAKGDADGEGGQGASEEREEDEGEAETDEDRHEAGESCIPVPITARLANLVWFSSFPK